MTHSMPHSHPLLEVTDLTKHYPVYAGMLSRSKLFIKAVDGISLSIDPGESLGLVGESGCGKTTVGRCILRLIEPSSGEIRFDGTSILNLPEWEMRKKRRHMQIIFQDPYASLNPRMTVGNIIGEGLTVHKMASGESRINAIRTLMETVGLDPTGLERYPHEFSGGQRQRIGIARALAVDPRLIICDEPVSALDVSIQAQIINLLIELQEKYGLAYLFIAHDLAVVQHISHRVAVMYLGRIVEIGSSHTVYGNPLHPYTNALLSSVPVPDPSVKQNRIILEGDVPTPLNPPSGCRFHSRCPIGKNESICRNESPSAIEYGKGHFVACHFSEKL